MDEDLAPEDAAFRDEVRSFLSEKFDADLRRVAGRQAGVFAEGEVARRWHRMLYERGWAEYEWRWQLGDVERPPRTFPQPLWDGSNLAGKRIFLYPDQGYGDTIQMIRYAAILQQEKQQRNGKDAIAAGLDCLTEFLQEKSITYDALMFAA